MPDISLAHLNDRGVVRIAGVDAITLLDNLITNSMDGLSASTAIHSGLLSPQGKILFDFFITRDGDDLLFEIAKTSIPELIKRLTFYRLRAKVTFSDETDALAVAAAWGVVAPHFPGGVLAYADPRQAGLGYRLILPHARLAELSGNRVDAADYHRHRIQIGVPEAGLDFELADTFPHEALYDQSASVDFRKGCYIGQEVVSRMQHRGTARKRILPVVADSTLVAGTEVHAGEAAIGRIGSASDGRALALIRLDRAHAAAQKGTPLMAGNIEIKLQKPTWLRLDITTGRQEEPSA